MNEHTHTEQRCAIQNWNFPQKILSIFSCDEQQNTLDFPQVIIRSFIDFVRSYRTRDIQWLIRRIISNKNRFEMWIAEVAVSGLSTQSILFANTCRLVYSPIRCPS